MPSHLSGPAPCNPFRSQAPLILLLLVRSSPDPSCVGKLDFVVVRRSSPPERSVVTPSGNPPSSLAHRRAHRRPLFPAVPFPSSAVTSSPPYNADEDCHGTVLRLRLNIMDRPHLSLTVSSCPNHYKWRLIPEVCLRRGALRKIHFGPAITFYS